MKKIRQIIKILMKEKKSQTAIFWLKDGRRVEIEFLTSIY
jgi:hypothetical protein